MVKKSDTTRRYTAEQRARALELLAANMRVRDVAKETGASQAAVTYWKKVSAAGATPTEAVTQPLEIGRNVRDHRIEMALSCLREYRKALEAAAGGRYSRNDHYAMLALSWLEGKR